jgi:predicted transcriptional regulator
VNAGDVLEETENILSADNSIDDVKEWIKSDNVNAEVFAVVSDKEELIGILKAEKLMQCDSPGDTPVTALIQRKPVYVYTDSKLSFAVDLMDRFKTDYLPVVERDNKKIAGILSYKDIFAAYRQRKNEETIYKRAISLRRQGYKIIVRGKQLFKG